MSARRPGDPPILYTDPAKIKAELGWEPKYADIQSMVKEMIDAFGKDRYVVNLGHGILPNIPVPHVKAFVEATPISGPALVRKTKSDSRAKELEGTLQIPRHAK